MVVESPQLLFIFLSHCSISLFNFDLGGRENLMYFGCNGILLNGTEPKLTYKNATKFNQIDAPRLRIYGGDGSEDTSHVVRISLTEDIKKVHCTGTIHNALYIITAAHCVQDVETSKLLVSVGQITSGKLASQIRSVVSTEIYEDWDSKTFSNDLALIKLNDSLVLTASSAAPVLLGQPNLPNATESKTYLTGYGLSYSTWGNKTFSPGSGVQVTATIVDLKNCKEIYHKLGKQVNKNEICAGGEVGSGPCNGDDGAPLSIRVTNEVGLYKVFVVGILSRYEPNCAVGVPDIYLELENYKTWIQSKAGRSCDFNKYAQDNSRPLKRSSKKTKPKGRIDKGLAKAICITFYQFLGTSNIQGPVNSPTTVQNYTEFVPYFCSNWQWNTCTLDVCPKFERVPCHQAEHVTKFRGNPNPTSRIMGGSDAQRNQYPYIVRISVTNDDYVHSTACNGVIYNSLYVLTSAECVHSAIACQLTAIAGDHSVTLKDETEQIRRVVAIIMHENFDRYNYFENDIALLKLESPLNFTKYVYSAVLATKDYSTVDVTSVELSGWGSFNALYNRKDVLQTVQIPLIDDCNCRLAYSNQDGIAINANKFCVGGDGYGLCKEEYGNPVTVTDGGNKYVFGISSFTSACGFHPGVATKVSAYHEWIALRAGM